MPTKREDKISTWLVKEQTPDGDRVRVAKHGEDGADHAVSYYRVVEQAAQTLSWLEMEPYTGRTHQLRVHAAHIGCPIIGDPKYFEADTNWDFPGGMQNRLHLHARRIVIPHPDTGVIDVTAPMPPHMRAELEPARLRRCQRRGRGMSTAAGTLERRDAVDTAAVAFMLALTFSWGLNGVAAKLSNTGFNPVFLTLARSAIGGLLVFLWCRYRGIRLFRRDGTLRRRPARRLLFGMEFVLIFVGLEYTTVARSTLMVNTMPFWVLIGAHFLLGEHMSLLKLGGLLLAFARRRAGVFRQAQPAATRRRSSATCSASAAACLGGDHAGHQASRLATASAEKILLYQLSVSAVVAVPMLLFAGPVFREVTAVPVAALLFQAVYVVAFTYVVWFWLMQPLSGCRAFELHLPHAGFRRAVRRPAARRTAQHPHLPGAWH